MNDAMPSGSDSEGPDEAVRRDVAGSPRLPYANTFLVQFAAETGARLEHAGGRVEHLQSGRRVRFESTADLLVCMVSLLAGEPVESAGQLRRRRGRGAGSTRPPAAP